MTPAAPLCCAQQPKIVFGLACPAMNGYNSSGRGSCTLKVCKVPIFEIACPEDEKSSYDLHSLLQAEVSGRPSASLSF